MLLIGFRMIIAVLKRVKRVLLDNRALFCTYLWRVRTLSLGVRLGRSVMFYGLPVIKRALSSHIIIGDHVVVRSSFSSNPIGCFQRTILRTVRAGASIVLENDSGISGATLCASENILIGEGSQVGAGVLIMDNDFHSLESGQWVSDVSNSRPVIVGKNCFIGARSIILKGVTLEDCCVVGAGAVVVGGIYCRGSVLAGNPARIVGEIDCGS